MRFVFTNKRPTLKAGKGSPDVPEYRILHDIADSMAPVAQGSLTRGFKTFSNRIDLHDVVDALERGDTDAVAGMVPWNEFDSDLKELNAVTIRGIERAGTKSIEFFNRSISKLLPTIEKPIIAFDSENTRIMNHIRSQTGTLVQRISESSRESIRQAIEQGFRVAKPNAQIAEDIRRSIPLHPRQTKAVGNFYDRSVKAWIKEGLSPTEAMKKAQIAADRYAERQLTYRAKLIARTETMSAVNDGQLEMWQQAADMGLFDKERARKKWSVTPDDSLCPICRPMEGIMVPIDQPWLTPNGKQVMIPTRIHPACRCAMGLVFI